MSKINNLLKQIDKLEWLVAEEVSKSKNISELLLSVQHNKNRLQTAGRIYKYFNPTQRKYNLPFSIFVELYGVDKKRIGYWLRRAVNEELCDLQLRKLIRQSYSVNEKPTQIIKITEDIKNEYKKFRHIS